VSTPWYERLYPECRSWLEQQLVEQKFNLEEIKQLFDIKFPLNKVQFTLDDLRDYAIKHIKGWSEPAPGLGKAVEEEVSKVEDTREFLTEEDREKVNAIKKHRRLLKEYWQNYRRLKTLGTNVTSQIKCLENISKELVLLQELEGQERTILSLLDEVRKAEEREPPEDHLDYIVGWAVPQLCRKVEKVEDAIFLLKMLKKNVNKFLEILKEEKEQEEQDLEYAIRVYLEYLYGGKKDV